MNIQMDIQWTLESYVLKQDYKHPNGLSMDIGVLNNKQDSEHPNGHSLAIENSKWTFNGHWSLMQCYLMHTL